MGENNRIFNYQAINSVEGASGNQTVILDCSSGEVANGHSITTSNPYLVRQSTGERIYIDSNNRDEYIEALQKIDHGENYDLLQIIIVKSIIKTMAELHKSWQ